MTQMKINKRKKNPTIFSLPIEMITEILATVASHSLRDFFAVKLSCKVFHQITDDKYILRHVSLDKFPIRPMCSTKQAFFLDKCMNNGHPEALYREGVVEYFGFSKVKEGINHLSNAAKVGHLGACYVLGVILLCGTEHDVQKGRQLMKHVKSAKCIRESRRNLKDIISTIWVHQFLEARPQCCPMQEQHRRRRGWPVDDEDDLDCVTCGCDLEMIFVCNSLPGITRY